MTKEERRKRRAIRRGVNTRLANAAMWKRWREIDEPALRRQNALFNRLLQITPVSVRWNPLGKNCDRRLKHNAEYADLLKVEGHLWTVLIEGYKRPQVFHHAFWEPLLPSREKTGGERG